MEWFKRNVSVGNVVVILILTVNLFKGNILESAQLIKIAANDKLQDSAISLNSDFRKGGHPYTEIERKQLEIAYSVATNPDVHMPYSTKVKEFVPRSEFIEMQKQTGKIADRHEKIYDMVLAIYSNMSAK